MRSLIQDVRYALRLMMRNRAVTAVALFSLAVSIGTAAAIFSVVDAIGLRPLAIRDPEHLIRLYSGDATHPQGETSYADFIVIRSGARQLADVAAWRTNGVGVSGGDRPPEITMIAAVSETFFSLLGVSAAVGRPFRADETSVDHAAPVILISDDYWKRRFDRDRTAVNSTLRLNGAEYTIVGVLPASFRGLDRIFSPDIWVPIGAEPNGQRPPIARDRRTLGVVARLRGDATLRQAQVELDALAAWLAATYPDTHANRKLTIEFEAAARRKWVAPAAVVLLIIPGLVLLIACANVAGLMIGQGDARRGEIAVRLALGAGRRRLLRQFLTESVLLAIVAGTIALLVSFWSIRLLPALLPDLPVPLGLKFRLDARVVAFTMATALLAVPVFGLLPAFSASRPVVATMLNGTAPGLGRSRRFTFRNVLTVGQIAGSLALLVMAGLLVRSLVNSSQIDVGFAKRPMILSTLAPGIAGYEGPQSSRFLLELLERMTAMPSVESATLARHMPLNSLFGGGATLKVRVPGHDLPDGEPLRLPYNVVEQHYFSTMGIPVLRGRQFMSVDRWPGRGVALINQTMARRFWPTDDPIGRHIEVVDRQPERRQCEIVGIVADGKYVMMNETPAPYVYLPFEQQPVGEVTVILRTRGPSSAAMEDFRRALRALDPAMPAMQIVTLDQHMKMALMFERTAATLVGALGGLALVLAIVGLYGVISYIAARRTREIGIRMALGARPADVLSQILKQGGGFALTGALIGLPLGAAAARLMGSVLYGVSSYDPLTYMAVGGLVVVVALAATYVPAQRAARVDPVQALRCE